MQVFGINDGEGNTTAQNFVRNFGLTYPILLDPGGLVTGLYPMIGITPYPRDVIIDQNGIIAYMNSEYDPQYMLQTVNSLLGINDITKEEHKFLPKDFQLIVYPNPFNPVTTVSFNVFEELPIRLDIYNLLGQKIQSQKFENYSVGDKASISINMENNPTGVYFINLTNGIISNSAKLLLLR